MHDIQYKFIKSLKTIWGFPGSSAGKESTCNAEDLGFNPWVGKIPWRRERLPTPLFWPGEVHGLYSPWGHRELNTTEQLSLSFIAEYLKRAIPSKTFLHLLYLSYFSLGKLYLLKNKKAV